MSKPTKKQQTTEEPEGARFREGYHKHHGLNEGRECTPEENKACMQVYKLVLSLRLSVPEGQERIQEILHPEVPF